MVSQTDQQLVTEFLEGNNHAFRLLTERYQQKVFTICIGFTHDKDEANDVSQETFIEVFRSLPKFRGQSSFSTWLYRIAVTKSMKFVQRDRFKKFKLSLDSLADTIGYEQSDTGNLADDRINRQETKKMLKKALSSLPKKQRIAFVLNKYKELTNTEISEIMTLPVATVDTLIHRARKNMKHYIIKYGGNYGM
ncbi:MAG: sigma-70 family RNA polymerase sigma factor [Marinilabiliaceae bacterium]|nr:sigma-70 family RNA polymerase sigma factor [Marinilabiliaceae bacterium]